MASEAASVKRRRIEPARLHHPQFLAPAANIELDTKASRTEWCYKSIRDRIVEGDLRPGDHLVQEDLAADLKVSRQPIQQALLLLRNDGLIVEIGTRGLKVAPLDPIDTAQRYQIRAALEGVAVRLAAIRAAASSEFAAQFLQQGQRLVEAGRQAISTGSARDLLEADMKFHRFFYQASGNPLIDPTLETNWAYLRRVTIAALKAENLGPGLWAEHEDILRATAKGRADEAVALATAHVWKAEGSIARALEAINGSGSSHHDEATVSTS